MKKQRRNELLLRQITERLKEIRHRKNLAQEAVGFDTDLNIGRIESGRHSITFTTLAILCEYYGITFEQFFRDW